MSLPKALSLVLSLLFFFSCSGIVLTKRQSLDFKSFLSLHYQSTQQPIPAIPEYTVQHSNTGLRSSKNSSPLEQQSHPALKTLPLSSVSISYSNPSSLKSAPIIHTTIQTTTRSSSSETSSADNDISDTRTTATRVDIKTTLAPLPLLVNGPPPNKAFKYSREESTSIDVPFIDAPFADTQSQSTKIDVNMPKLAIVIDDIGNNRLLDTRAANLPGKVTLAILPFTPHSKTTANLAHKNNKEVMLHAPMESLNGLRLGDGALTKELNEKQFSQTLQRSIDSIPHISGLNNHMGSSLTQSTEAMNWVMQAAKNNHLFFVDSRTTHQSVAGDLAKQYQVAHASRNIFLDNETEYDYIDQAFNRALSISKKTGFAVAIGHPYPATLSYLESKLPELHKQGIVLVSVRDLITAQTLSRAPKSSNK